MDFGDFFLKKGELPDFGKLPLGVFFFLMKDTYFGAFTQKGNS